MKRFFFCVIFSFLISCSFSDKHQTYHYSNKLYSKGYKYALIYKNAFPVQDSLRVDEFTIYKLNSDAKHRLLRSEEIEDSLLGDTPHVTPDSLQNTVDFDEDGSIIRKFRITFHKSDTFYDSLFTQNDFSYNLEDSTLNFSATGLTIKLE